MSGVSFTKKVLNHFVSYATKYGSPGGKVSVWIGKGGIPLRVQVSVCGIQVEIEQKKKAQAGILAESETFLRLQVSDLGSGSVKNVESLFEPFETVGWFFFFFGGAGLKCFGRKGRICWEQEALWV